MLLSLDIAICWGIFRANADKQVSLAVENILRALNADPELIAVRHRQAPFVPAVAPGAEGTEDGSGCGHVG